MKVYCMVNELKYEHVKDYEGIHQTAHLTKWKTQLKALKDAGAKNCNVFVYKNLSIVFYECEDLNESLAKLNEDKDNVDWQKEVGKYFDSNPKFNGKETVTVKKVFDLNQQLDGYLDE